ncbi:MAG: CPBP family intramembrane metalloprotease [Phycisphaeraceae bacterium]|nr:CPBP family intramembrane metalloprotease [Phycisphaeraceae bacterium]
MSRRTAGVVIGLIVLFSCAGIARAQDLSSERGERPATIAERLEAVKNLKVREAVEQLAANWTTVVLIASVVVLVFLVAAGVLRPGGFARAGTRDCKSYPAFLWLFAAMVMFLALPLAVDAIGRVPIVDRLAEGQSLSRAAGFGEGEPSAAERAHMEQIGEAQREMRREAIVKGCGYAACSALGLGLMVMLARGAPDAGLRFGGMDPMLAVGCFILSLPIVQLADIGAQAAYEQFADRPPPVVAHDLLRMIVDQRSDPYVWALIGAAVIGAPIVEEITFRVGLQSFFMRTFGGPWPGVFITSVIFTSLHWSALPAEAQHGWGVLLLGSLFVFSLCLGVAYERTRRPGVPIVMHMLFNAMNVVIAMSMKPEAA